MADFQKTFDSVNRNFLYETLSTLGLGLSFIQWVRTFYQNISSCVVNNGFATAHFSIQRGVRQGDPLSPYLFIIVLKVLAIRIRGDPSIRGVNVNGNDIKLQIFADDLTGFVRNEQSFNRFLDTTEEFGKCSGLRINFPNLSPSKGNSMTWADNFHLSLLEGLREITFRLKGLRAPRTCQIIYNSPKLDKLTGFNHIFIILWQTKQIKSLFNLKDKNTHRSRGL